MTIYDGNDNVVTLSGLYDVIAGGYSNDATVTWAIAHDGGSPVASGVLTYVAGSRGNYRGIIEEDIDWNVHPSWHIDITADAGNDRIGFWKTDLIIATRSA